MRVPPSSTFTQATATGPVSSPTSWDPKDGSTASCRPKLRTSRTIRSAACGRLRRSRAERTSKPSRRTSWRCRRSRNERLRPGGSYVIVDHAAAVGSGTSDAQSLHRIEPASVREEVEAAGFVLDAESTMLANKDDPHSIKVFDPSIKGETDRFAYRFVKP